MQKSKKYFTEMEAEDGMEKSGMAGSLSNGTQVEELGERLHLGLALWQGIEPAAGLLVLNIADDLCCDIRVSESD